MFSLLNPLGKLGVIVPVLMSVVMAGVIWWQQDKLDSKDKEIKSLEANITQCESRVEAKSFESKWANEFNSAWKANLYFSTQNESKPKGGKDEKSDVTTNSNTFYDSF